MSKNLIGLLKRDIIRIVSQAKLVDTFADVAIVHIGAIVRLHQPFTRDVPIYGAEFVGGLASGRGTIFFFDDMQREAVFPQVIF